MNIENVLDKIQLYNAQNSGEGVKKSNEHKA